MNKYTIKEWTIGILATIALSGAIVAAVIVPQITFGKAGCLHASIRYNTEYEYVGPPYYKQCYLHGGDRWMSTGEYSRLYGREGN